MTMWVGPIARPQSPEASFNSHLSDAREAPGDEVLLRVRLLDDDGDARDRGLGQDEARQLADDNVRAPLDRVHCRLQHCPRCRRRRARKS
jgi:hypothetical protein